MSIEKGTILKTRFGSKVQVLIPPDAEGWTTVRRIDDGEIREWNMSDMHIVTSAERVAP